MIVANEMVKYQTDHGEVALSSDTIKRYLVPSGANVTDQEIMMFMKLCEYQGLNPFLREVYLVKYGDSPASIVTGKETFTKRAMKNESYAGMEAGITVVSPNSGKIERREGSLKLADEILLGGWAKVHVKGHSVPYYDEVSFDEYAGKKRDGTLNGMWATKPATMIRKVAIVHALREAFPQDFEGLYSPEEINTVDVSALSDKPIDIPRETVTTIPVTPENEDAEPENMESYAIEPNSGEPMYSRPVAKPTPVAHVAPVSAVRPNSDYVPYRAGGKHKYAGKMLSEIPENFLNMVAHSEVEPGTWHDRNVDIQNKVIAYIHWTPPVVSVIPDMEKLPFDLD